MARIKQCVGGSLAAIGLMCSFSTAIAQNCDKFVERAMYNIEIKLGTDARMVQAYYSHCEKNLNLETNSTIGHIEADIPGFGSGSASLAIDKRRENIKDWCTKNKSSAQSNQSLYQQTRSIYEGSVETAQKCHALVARGVKFSSTISDDSRTVDFSLSNTFPQAEGIIFLGVKAESFTCETILPRPVVGRDAIIRIGVEAISIHCTRHDPITERRDGQDVKILRRATISVATALETLQFFFEEQATPDVLRSARQALETQIANLKQIVDQHQKTITQAGEILNTVGNRVQDMQGQLRTVQQSAASLQLRYDEPQRACRVETPGNWQFVTTQHKWFSTQNCADLAASIGGARWELWCLVPNTGYRRYVPGVDTSNPCEW
ncbi:MAG: hypothetical protein AB7P02_13275 [Alphaproteobacteria bacterium]